MTTTGHILYEADDREKAFAKLQPRLIFLGRFVSTGRWYLNPLEHDFYTISYVQQGHAKITVDNKAHHARAGSILVYSPFVSYRAQNVSPYMDYQTLIFRFTTSENTRLPTTFAPSATLVIQRLLGMIHKQVLTAVPDHRVIKTLLLEILELAYKPAGKSNPLPQASRVLDAMQWIREHLDEPFDLPLLAQSLNISTSHLSHLFKQHADTSANAYYQSLKMDQAKALLCDSDLSLKAVADRLGYASIHHFTRRFSAVVGMPPGAFRQSQNQSADQRTELISEDGGPVV
jgi:AraC-like DNA-binding protein